MILIKILYKDGSLSTRIGVTEMITQVENGYLEIYVGNVTVNRTFSEKIVLVENVWLIDTSSGFKTGLINHTGLEDSPAFLQ